MAKPLPDPETELRQLTDLLEHPDPPPTIPLPGALVLLSEIRRVAAVVDAQDREIERLRAELPRGERLRLAAWFEGNSESLRAFVPDGLSVELVAFLLRLDHTA